MSDKRPGLHPWWASVVILNIYVMVMAVIVMVRIDNYDGGCDSDGEN